MLFYSMSFYGILVGQTDGFEQKNYQPTSKAVAALFVTQFKLPKRGEANFELVS